MGSISEPLFQTTIDHFRSQIEITLEGIESLRAWTEDGRALDALPGWRELKGRPLVWASKGEKPWLVATLFGPTGAGKSTVFSLLTGLQVPAGNVIRPVTFNPIVAIPQSLSLPHRIAGLFPFKKLSPLDDFEKLMDKTARVRFRMLSGDSPSAHTSRRWRRRPLACPCRRMPVR